MFSKTLLVALSLLTLTASSALGSPARSCPAPSTVTVVASSSASASASNIAVASSAVGSSTSSTSNTRKGKGSKGKGGAKGATTSSALSSTEAIVSSTSSAASNIAVASSSTVLSSTASATSSSTDGIGGTGKSGDKGAASSAVSSASVATASSTANTAAASSSAANSTSASGSGDDAQTATTLAQAVIATGFALDGQQVPAAGQVASLTSTNNFINFCLTVNKPITNGQQVKTGSCNPAPMGVIAATTNMPSSKFLNPTNFGTMKANTAFTIQMAIQNIQTGNFVNAADNYYSAPQQVNSAGNIIGHSHVVIEQLSSLNQTTTTDPTKFAFFKGINGAAVNGIVTADVTAGLPAGSYRLASINAAANHQPVLVAVAQHGSLDDMVYFTVE